MVINMLKTKDLIEKLGEDYAPMLRKISIPDFTKCVAQMAGIPIQEVSDKSMEEYLTFWCKNKKRFFDLMGGNTRVDIPFKYIDECRNLEDAYESLGINYPIYEYWLREFETEGTNKISYREHNYSWKSRMGKLFPGINLEGMAITSFFKRYLSAPDELVTEIGRIYENGEVDANFTISIDPVDMMLASENPYGWTSCYRLENDFESSHADGCLAAIIDSDSLITYVWNNEGKFSLYNNYEFKSVRFKRMRMWIAISENCHSVHFNEIYPGKSDYSDGFRKKLRAVVEEYLCNQLGVENKWKHNVWNGNSNETCEVHREYPYGYSEYSDDYIYNRSEVDAEDIWVYNNEIVCPCGCGDYLPGSEYDEDDMEYNGEGHIRENYYTEERQWCDECDEYVDCDGDCRNCETWMRNHPVCELDEDEECDDRDMYDAENDGDFEPWNSNIVRCNPEHCRECPLYRKHHPEEDTAEAEEEADQPDTESHTITIDSVRPTDIWADLARRYTSVNFGIEMPDQQSLYDSFVSGIWNNNDEHHNN